MLGYRLGKEATEGTMLARMTAETGATSTPVGRQTLAGALRSQSAPGMTLQLTLNDGTTRIIHYPVLLSEDVVEFPSGAKSGSDKDFLVGNSFDQDEPDVDLTAQLQVLSAVPTPASTSQACVLYSVIITSITYDTASRRSGPTARSDATSSRGLRSAAAGLIRNRSGGSSRPAPSRI